MPATIDVEGRWDAVALIRDKEELRRLRETRDPLHNLRERLDVSEQEWERMDEEARQVVDEAVAFAKARNDAKPDGALLNIDADTTER